MKKVVAAILGGGQGARLWPLTQYRAKPSVPLGGKFRLIDIPISNCLHAGVNRIFVLTQFNSASLHRHIAQTYRFDVFSSGFVNILAAEQNLDNRGWYQGTADAVRQTLHRLTDPVSNEILILSGDQLYLMDLKSFVLRHRERDADLTIAVKPVSKDQAKELGIMRVDPSGRIVEFVEKPSDPDTIERLALDRETIATLGLDAVPGSLLASMGIYTFRPGVLAELLTGTDTADFGKEVIPNAIDAYKVYGFLHEGYWSDIGTIPSFHEASLELAGPSPALDLYDERYPIYTHPRFLPGSRVTDCEISDSIVCDGSRLTGSRIHHSIIGVRAVVQAGSVIEDSVVMGAGRFEAPGRGKKNPRLGVGKDCHIRRAIVDLDARIGDGCRLVNEAGLRNADGEFYYVREGIIVIPRRAIVPHGTVI